MIMASCGHFFFAGMICVCVCVCVRVCVPFEGILQELVDAFYVEIDETLLAHIALVRFLVRVNTLVLFKL